jgi:hypothetical protein
MSPKIRTLFLFLVGSLVSFTLGCAGGDSPVEAAAPVVAPSFSTTGGPDLDRIARFRVKPQTSYGWAKKWIGPAGGRLDFLGFAIVVPPGAVDKVTMFSIQVPLDREGSERVMAEFGPHNKAFAVPVQIEFPLANTSIETSATPTVVWWDGTSWVDIGAALTPDGQRLRATTPHFSTYGTTDQRGGTLLISGG